MGEHLNAYDDRRARWYAATVLPVRAQLGLDIVRLCEGWVARRLSPLEGSAHPRISPEMPVELAVALVLRQRIGLGR